MVKEQGFIWAWGQKLKWSPDSLMPPGGFKHSYAAGAALEESVMGLPEIPVYMNENIHSKEEEIAEIMAHEQGRDELVLEDVTDKRNLMYESGDLGARDVGFLE